MILFIRRVQEVNNNYINNRKEFKFHLNSRNINYKRIVTKDKRNIPKELLKNIKMF